MLEHLNETVVSFPDFFVVTFEIRKINQTVDNLDCFNNIINAVKKINDSIVIIPQQYSQIVNNFGTYKSMIYSIDVSQIENNIQTINKTVKGDLLNVFSTYNQSQISDLLNRQPNITSIRSTISDANSRFNNSLASFNPNQTVSDSKSFKNSLTSMPNMTGYIQPLANLNNSINSIPASLIDSVIGIVKTCHGTYCSPFPGAAKTACNNLADKIQQLRDSANARPNATEIQSKLDSFSSTVSSFPDMEELIGKVDTMKNSLGDLPPFDLNSIIAANTSLASIDNLPFNSIESNMNMLNTIPAKSSFSSSINSAKTTLDQIVNFNVDGLLDTIQNSLGFINISSIFSIIDGQFSNIQETIAGAQSFEKTVLEYRKQYFVQVWLYDGYRLLGITLLIGLAIFLPILSCFVVCCYRKPCLLLCQANACNIITLLLFLVVAVGIPVNVLLGDVCPNIETIAIDGVQLLFPPVSSMKIQQRFSIQTIALNVNITPIELVKLYTVDDCVGFDPIQDIVQQIHVILSNSTNLLHSLLDTPLPGGFILHPNIIVSF